ncbi:MAG: bifunctional nuclease family protein [Bacteroidia bacterium]|nr:bifunctional nuclease family protein [Bacteroidia bacterium]
MEKIRLHIYSIASSEQGAAHYAIILEEEGGNRHLPIIIGAPEAQAIALELEKIKTTRPMTHDLISNILDHFDIQLKSVIITHLQEGTFFAKLLLSSHDEEHEIDCRPSDGIALAVRSNAPIYTFEKIMSEAGIEKETSSSQDEKDLEDSTKPSRRTERKSAASPMKNPFEQLAELNEKLENALKNEDYELAAKIRDMINKLKD